MWIIPSSCIHVSSSQHSQPTTFKPRMNSKFIWQRDPDQFRISSPFAKQCVRAPLTSLPCLACCVVCCLLVFTVSSPPLNLDRPRDCRRRRWRVRLPRRRPVRCYRASRQAEPISSSTYHLSISVLNSCIRHCCCCTLNSYSNA